MTINHAFPLRFTYFDEATFATPPANASAWVSEVSIDTMRDSIDTSGLKETSIPVDQTQTSIFASADNIRGMRNLDDFGHSHYGYGSTSATSAASQVAATELGNLLGHALGATARGNTTDAKTSGTHSTTTVELTATTNITEGQIIGIRQDGATPVYWRRITDITSDIATFDQAVPFTIVDDDNVLAAINAYIDESVLVDAAAGPYSRSWHVQHGLSHAPENYVLKGCKSSLKTIGFERNNALMLAFSLMASSFDGPNDAPDPDFTAVSQGGTPVAIGAGTTVFLQDVGTTTSNEPCVSSFSVECGVPVARVATVTTSTTNAQGTCSYTTAPEDTVISLTLSEFDSTLWDDYEAKTRKVVRIVVTNPDAPEGNSFVFMAPNCEIIEMPSRAVAEQTSSVAMKLKAHPATDISGASNTALATSKFIIAMG